MFCGFVVRRGMITVAHNGLSVVAVLSGDMFLEVNSKITFLSLSFRRNSRILLLRVRDGNELGRNRALTEIKGLILKRIRQLGLTGSLESG